MAEEEKNAELPWREVLTSAFRHWRIVAACLVAGLALATLRASLEAPVYTAAATLMVRSTRAHVAVSPDAGSGATIDRVGDEAINSEAVLLRSESLARELLEPRRRAFEDPAPVGALGRIAAVVRIPSWLPGKLYRRFHGLPEPSAFDQWVDAISSRIVVTTVPKSSLIRVSFTASNAQWTADFVNKLVANYLERSTRLGKQAEAKEFYEEQRELLAQRARQAEIALAAFYTSEGADGSPEQQASLRAQLAEIEAALAKAETDIAEEKAKTEFLASEIKSLPKRIQADARPGKVDGGQLIQPRILELALQRSEMLSKYAPASMKIQDIDRQIEEAKGLLDKEKDLVTATTTTANPTYQILETEMLQTRAQLVATQARVGVMQSQQTEQRARIAHLDEIASTQGRLSQEVAAAKEAFNNYSKKEEAARFSSALDSSNIFNLSVAEPAEVPTSPIGSKKTSAALVGGLLGLALGMAAAVALDWLDPVVKSSAEARRITGLPIIGEVFS